MKLFHIIAINENTGKRVQLTGYPMSQEECITMKSKITRYNWRRIVLKECKQ